MLSAKKLLYLIIVSLILSCSILGIDYHAVTNEETDDEVYVVSYKPSSGFYESGSNVSLSADITPDEGTAQKPEKPGKPDTTTDPDTTTEPDSSTDPDTSTETTTTTGFDTSTETTSTQQITTTAATTTTTTTRRTTTTTTRRTTTTTTTTTRQTTAATTTTKRPTTTTTEKVYNNTGRVKFSPSQVRMYAGNKTTLSVDFSSAVGAYQITNVSSLNNAVVSARRINGSAVEINGLSVGVAWVQGIADNNDIFYCRVEITDFAGEVIRLTNEQRANYGLPPLEKGDYSVQRAADVRLGEIKKVFAHTRPNGKAFSTVAADVSLDYTHLGENLAMGQVTPQQVITEWMNSTSHRNNILSRKSTGEYIPYEYIVISYGKDGNGIPYWVQMFYTP